jgi:hypothetical protein
VGDGGSLGDHSLDELGRRVRQQSLAHTGRVQWQAAADTVGMATERAVQPRSPVPGPVKHRELDVLMGRLQRSSMYGRAASRNVNACVSVPISPQPGPIGTFPIGQLEGALPAQPPATR